MIVGLTGGIGSGKSAAMNVFESLGIGCVDADVVARQVVEPGQPALEAITGHFGKDVLTSDGQLDRPALRTRIFQSPDDKKWLEALLHPLIREEMQRQLRAQQSPYSILVAPLLFENELDKGCDATVLIDAPESVQIERVLARDGGSEEQARAIIRSQMSREEKKELADYVIPNTGTLAELRKQLVALHEQFMAQSAS